MGIQPAVRLTQATVLEVAINSDAGVAVFGEFSVTGQEGAGRTIRILGSVIDVRQMRRVAELDEAGLLDDLSRIQSRLAWKLIRSLRPESPVPLDTYLQEHLAFRLDAMESYIRGLLATGVEQQVRFFSAAARLAPGYPEPSLRLGMIQLDRKDYRSAAEWLGKVPSGTPRFREASFYLALCRHQLGDFATARTLLAAISQEAPLNEVFNNLGAAQARLDQEDALSSFGKAMEADPADPAAYFNAGSYLWRKARFEEAATRFKQVLERTPEDEAAETMIERCDSRQGPKPGDPRAERLKSRYDESGWLMLKRMFAPKAP
jgi:tetratricopeptide (TPR) repeat protein